MSARTLLVALVVALCGVGLRAQAVLVVAPTPGPGVDFTDLQAAVTAAPSGSVVLVKSGTYAPIVVLNKSLTIVADAGQSVTVAAPNPTGVNSAKPAIEIRDLAATQTVILHGLSIQGAPAAALSAVGILTDGQFTSSAGRLWAEDCAIVGRPALRVSFQGSSVAMLRCSLTGGNGFFNGSFTSIAGTAVEQSFYETAFYECTLQGGKGKDGDPTSPDPPARRGGIGVQLNSGAMLLARSNVKGGAGGAGFFDTITTSCSPPGDGGRGVTEGEILTYPALRLVQSTYAGGSSGTPGGGCNPAADGEDLFLLNGSVTEYSGDVPTLSTSVPVREGQLVSFTLTGPPAAMAMLAISAKSEMHFLSNASGELLVQFPAIVAPLIALPPSGVLTLSGVVPPLPAGIDGVPIFLQPVTCPVAGPCTIGSAAALVLLDGSL